MGQQNECSDGDYVALAGSSSASFSRASGATFADSSSDEIQQRQNTGEIAGAGAGAGAFRDSGGDVGAGRQKGKLTRKNVEMGNNNRKEDLSYGPSTLALPRKTILVYGTGHVLNDLTAACWFTYLLIFLTDVGLSPKQAGAVMLSGQLADGFATILVGQLIDNFGRFKVWHAGGSLLVAISFSSVFGVCIACELFGAESTSAMTLGYSVFAAIFNLGWAATQVSHMSLVNCITANSSSRVSLNSCRNAFSMVANLGLYAIAYAVFWSLPSRSADGVHAQFRWIAWVAILVGSCFVVVFLLGVREPKLYHHFQESKGNFTRISVLSWFKRILYYQVASVYMLTRLTTNVSQAFLPFYVVQDLKLGESSKAVVPALIYVCSFLASIALQELHWTGHRLKGVFTLGACLWAVSGVILYILPLNLRSSIYAIAGLIGLGNALMLVTATSMQGVLVGHDLSGCAFVYGSLSFVDKLACGCILYLIERLNDRTQSCTQSSGSVISCNDSLLRSALGLVPGGCALLAAIITLTMNLGGETESDPSLLGKLLPNKVESSLSSQEHQSVGDNAVQRLKGSNSGGSENSRAVGRPILPPAPRTSRHIRRGKEKPVEALDDDVEKNNWSSSSSSREGGSPSTVWKRLESAMVGRWGSIRKQPQTWLE